MAVREILVTGVAVGGGDGGNGVREGNMEEEGGKGGHRFGQSVRTTNNTLPKRR